jgi:hypothetical protein
MSKTCNICYEEKPLEQFYIQKGKPMCRCKDCQRMYARKWHQLNKLKMMETRAKFHNSRYRTKKMAEKQAMEFKSASTRTEET